MRVVPTLSWALADPAEALDARLLPLLAAIRAKASLAAAVADRGMSYRAAWGLLRDYQHKLGTPLVELKRGRGARLAPAGERLLAGHRAATQRLEGILAPLAVELGSPAGREPGVRVARLTVAASHDLVLAALRDALPAAAGLSLDLAFMGSLHALQQFAESRTDLAGFHVPIGVQAAGELAPFRRLLRVRRDRLIRVVDREQGFMLPRGNPARVHGFRDVERKRLRWVNRQRGSGTRLLIERLIADEGLEASSLVGYANEEFTHHAVAATVASGAADAGFGLRAAAAEYGLAFVPRGRERYYLAVRASALATPAVVRLIDVLQGPIFARVAGTLPGYRRDGAGTMVGVEALDA
ncbi:MAG TPA: helix-turn-helix transcriptional regulator [Casimicrobiaceae bacterium]|nr:helix-turn-helix transcriptional regulator [Casimicrobiaceae bacterium]